MARVIVVRRVRRRNNWEWELKWSGGPRGRALVAIWDWGKGSKGGVMCRLLKISKGWEQKRCRSATKNKL